MSGAWALCVPVKLISFWVWGLGFRESGFRGLGFRVEGFGV